MKEKNNSGKIVNIDDGINVKNLMCDNKLSKILDDILECSTCNDISKFEYKKRTGVELIDYLIENLPAVDYVIDEIINYIFSNGLTTGDKEDKDKLNEFLYRKNEEGTTNYDVLRTCIANSMLYGECGLRLYNGNLYHVKRGKYAPLVLKEDGIRKIAGWLVAKNDDAVVKWDIDREKDNVTLQDILAKLEKSHLMLLDSSEFVNVKNCHDKMRGISPFEKDQLRLRLLSSSYERLNYDVVYDGPGRIILRPKDGYFSSDDDEVSTSTIMNNSASAQKNRIEKAKKEAERVGKQIKNSSSDSVIVLSNAFDKDIEHLERVTKATEFLDWLADDVRIICQVLHIDPALVGACKNVGNTTMEQILDNGMLNSIIPLREKFAIQFSELISKHLGVKKVYFDKYKMRQQETLTAKLERYVNMEYKMLVGIKDTENTDVKSEILSTVKSIDKLIRDSLYDKGSTEVKSIEEV